MADIFINYRSDDDPFAAALADERLRRVFGEDRVFRDCRSLPAGIDFEPELWGHLLISKVFLVLIGRKWLTLTDPNGVRLLDRPSDFVRCEVAEALKLKTTVIPVLLNGAKLPKAAELPADLASLSGHQFVHLRQRFSDVDLAELVAAVAKVVVPIPTPPAPAAPANKSFSATSQSGNAYAAETMNINTEGPPK